ncbi:MAG: GNAT family N-acetyltransferase, partial [Acidobacteria bacterium]|nr:GNAT family N-acetyltransferase [Acidobacteriota bacterium]
CAALYPYPAEAMGELACLAVHPDYRNAGRGEELLSALERRAKAIGLGSIFVLSTESEHWFIERGFREAALEDLPMGRQELYNFQRNSKVFTKAF